VFCSKGNTLGRPLVLRDVGLVLVVHDELALPDTRKGQFPEIAVRQKDEMMKRAKEQIMDRQKQPTRTASIVGPSQFNITIKRTWRFGLSARKQSQIIL
jgi:hypothetical protein